MRERGDNLWHEGKFHRAAAVLKETIVAGPLIVYTHCVAAHLDTHATAEIYTSVCSLLETTI